MFNPHHQQQQQQQQQHHHQQQQQQQQQQQFHRHLRQLQQLFQHQPPPPPPPPPPQQPPPQHHVPHHHPHPHHHHQAGRTMAVPAPAPPPPRMVNMAAQATIMAPNPMLQGALMMQHMQGSMRSFAAMSGQQFTQFFAAGARASLLGPVPMGVAIKTPHMGFPARHYHPHARYYNNDYASRQPDRKRGNEQRASGSTDGQPSASQTVVEHNDQALKADGGVAGPGEQPSVLGEQSSVPAEPEEPVLKKQRTDGLEGAVEMSEAAGEHKGPEDDSQSGDCVILEEAGSTATPQTAGAMEESDCVILEEDGSTVGPLAADAQVQSGVSAVPASEQLSDESQMVTACLDLAEGTAAPETLEGGQEEGTEGGDTSSKFYCYICNITCRNQKMFQSHMNGLAHQQRMMEIQHMSNACLVTLLPRVQKSLKGAGRDGSSFRDGEKRPGLQRWCATCQTHFTCPVMEHRKSREHKLLSRTANTSCTVCKRDFKSLRLFLEHMQTLEHTDVVEKLREEGGAGSLDELVAMDTQGCLVADEEEEDEDEEEDEEEDREDDGHDTHGKEGWPTQMDVALLEDVAEDEEYDPDTVYGSSFVVPVAGFLCRLCQQFYNFESAARHSHCKSLQHFENLKKYRVLQRQKPVKAGPTNVDGDTECDHDISASNTLLPSELLSSPSSLRPTLSIPRLRSSRCCAEPQETPTAAASSSQPDLTITSSPEGSTVEASPEQQSPVWPEDKEEVPEPGGEEPDLISGEVDEEAESPEKSGKGKAKSSSKRRYGRTTRRR
ncbi:hypothetical protein UPYG_G00281850 [Umbra pygmaea]|uniref:Matrin-type domain-containing protein n=1 Tax=Umbra pygmaea TaxID=75934 RepID=A0ABD0WPA3_UMBPY